MEIDSKYKLATMRTRILTSLRWRLLQPTPPAIETSVKEMITLGSKYGRKSFIPVTPGYEITTVISGGVGEDISFDVELASRYECQIIFADPSQPAIEHFKLVVDSLGNEAKREYSNSSRQLVSSYNLSNVSRESFQFFPVGLWKSNTTLDFFLPPDSTRDSSGSISGIHSFYKPTSKSHKIKVVTVKQLMADSGLSNLNILKLDIEGAGLEVVQQMFKDHIFPDQILIEIDEMHFPSLKSKSRAQKFFRLFKKNGYSLVFIDSCDFLYVRKDILQ